jgi:hypothetical protein
MCNEGPGFCKELESDYGPFGMCLGVPTFGAECNDGNQCTTNDTCMAVFTDDHCVMSICVGTFDAELPCSDGDDQCTINDRYVLLYNFVSCATRRRVY